LADRTDAVARFVREHERDVEPPIEPVRHLQKRPVFLVRKHDAGRVLLPGHSKAPQRVRLDKQAAPLVPRSGSPVEDRDQKPQVAFDHPVRHGFPARANPARLALPDEPVPVALGECFRPSVPAEEPEKHPHRDPVVPLGVLALGGCHLSTVDVKQLLQRERLGLGFGLAVGLMDREACSGLVGLSLRASPIAVLQRPREPAPILAPLDLVSAGLRIRKHPDPVPAPFAGAVAPAASFRACHHSIPLVMD